MIAAGSAGTVASRKVSRYRAATCRPRRNLLSSKTPFMTGSSKGRILTHSCARIWFGVWFSSTQVRGCRAYGQVGSVGFAPAPRAALLTTRGQYDTKARARISRRKCPCAGDGSGNAGRPAQRATHHCTHARYVDDDARHYREYAGYWLRRPGASHARVCHSKAHIAATSRRRHRAATAKYPRGACVQASVG